jgi:hypothetical protein
MKLKSVELDLTALMSEVMFGHGYAHYGYFPDGVPEVLSAAAMGAAQHAYFERLEAAIATCREASHVSSMWGRARGRMRGR